jgi:hypothetical protein
LNQAAAKPTKSLSESSSITGENLLSNLVPHDQRRARLLEQYSVDRTCRRQNWGRKGPLRDGQYQKIGGCWLPLKDETTAAEVRILGKDILTIYHNNYQVRLREDRTAKMPIAALDLTRQLWLKDLAMKLESRAPHPRRTGITHVLAIVGLKPGSYGMIQPAWNVRNYMTPDFGH